MANGLPVFSNLRLFTYIQHSVETMLSLPQNNNLSVSELFIVFSSGTKVNIQARLYAVSQVYILAKKNADILLTTRPG